MVFDPPKIIPFSPCNFGPLPKLAGVRTYFKKPIAIQICEIRFDCFEFTVASQFSMECGKLLTKPYAQEFIYSYGCQWTRPRSSLSEVKLDEPGRTRAVRVR